MIDWIELKEYSKSLLNNTLTLIDKIEVEATDFSIRLNSNTLKTLSNEEIKILVEKKFGIIDYNPVYYIQLVGDIDTETIANAFKQAKQQKYHSRCYSKFNHSASRTLYVGISQGKSFKKRMREHLGSGAKSTYALNLKYWLPADVGIKIIVFKPQIPQSTKNHMNLMELMEQSLWDKLQPMMGKRSGQL